MIIKFKIYEMEGRHPKQLNPKYQIGDIVLLDTENVIIGRIVDWKSWSDITTPDYYIEIFDKQNHIYFNRHWIEEEEIERTIDKEEMKLLLKANKYNL